MIKPEQCERLTRKARKTLEEYGLGTAADLLVSSSRWGIRLDVSTLDEYRRTGNSRVGGNPDLPEHIQWPLTQDGVPMTFLAQLNLVDLLPYTPNDGRVSLPERGMLYFFIGVDEPAYNIEHHVIYEPDSHNLIRREPEGVTALETEFAAHAVTVLPNLEFPTYAYVDAQALNALSVQQTGENEVADPEGGCMSGILNSNRTGIIRVPRIGAECSVTLTASTRMQSIKPCYRSYLVKNTSMTKRNARTS